MTRVTCTVALALIAAAAMADARRTPDTTCLLATGKAATKCIAAYEAAVGTCRDKADAACESALRAAGGKLDGLLAATEAPARRDCTAESAGKLTFTLGIDDLAFRTRQACQKWAEDFLAVTYADDLAGLTSDARVCQRKVARQLRSLRDKLVLAYGRKCYVPEFAGKPCDRQRRDDVVAKARAAATAAIVKRCGATFDRLGLSTGATTGERIAALVDVVASRTRHLALRVYPPMGLGPTEFIGPAPIGVRTLELVDPSRLNVEGTGPRPVKIEVYYPSTAAAVAGVPRDVLHLFGFDVPTNAYRDVARAPGALPLVLYSHGGGGSRVENESLAGHLASHGFLVVAPDHHGDNYFETVLDTIGEYTNRPRDLSFLIDRFLQFNSDPGNFFEGAVDGARIGATGHSMGGYTVMALATGPFQGPFEFGTFTDPRVKAILPLDPAVTHFHTAASIFSTITVPTLMLSGTQSLLAGLLPPVFGAFLHGPAVMGFGNLHDAAHLSFMDICESPEGLTGFNAECEPDHLPWRYALHVVNYLALNFFDATLNGNAEALARLDPALLSNVEELEYQSK